MVGLQRHTLERVGDTILREFDLKHRISPGPRADGSLADAALSRPRHSTFTGWTFLLMWSSIREIDFWMFHLMDPWVGALLSAAVMVPSSSSNNLADEADGVRTGLRVTRPWSLVE